MIPFKVSGAVLANLAKIAAVLGGEEFAFTVQGEKLSVCAGDTGRIAIVVADYPIKDGPVEPLVFNHDVRRFADKLDGLAKEPEVNVSYVAPHMVMQAGRKKRIVACVDARTAQSPKPPQTLPWTAHVDMPLAFLKDACSSNDDYTLLTVKVENGDLSLTAADELDTYEDSMPAPGSEPCSSGYTPKMLAMLLKPADAKSDVPVTLHFGNDLPLAVDYALPEGGKCRVYLAPRV